MFAWLLVLLIPVCHFGLEAADEGGEQHVLCADEEHGQGLGFGVWGLGFRVSNKTKPEPSCGRRTPA